MSLEEMPWGEQSLSNPVRIPLPSAYASCRFCVAVFYFTCMTAQPCLQHVSPIIHYCLNIKLSREKGGGEGGLMVFKAYSVPSNMLVLEAETCWKDFYLWVASVKWVCGLCTIPLWTVVYITLVGSHSRDQGLYEMRRGLISVTHMMRKNFCCTFLNLFFIF